MAEDIKQQIADGARPLARVGDVITHGEAIPASVRTVSDKARDTWDRFNSGWSLVSYKGERYDDSTAPLADDQLIKRWGPLTVVEVDPEPQPAERKLIGPPHAHQDAPCTDACYEPVAPFDLLELVRLYGHEGHKSGFAAAERDEEADDHHDGKARRLYDQIEAEVQRLRAEAADYAARLKATDRSWAEVARERDEARAEVDRLTPADPGPVVLSLPQVPDGATALIGGRTGNRYVSDGVNWESEAWAGTYPGLLWHERPDGVTVEMAPPREPRTWPKLDAPPDIDDLPTVVDVEGHGRWSRLATHHFYPEADPNGAPLTLAQLRELGEVREVLT